MTDKRHIKKHTYFVILSVLIAMVTVLCIMFVDVKPSAYADASLFKNGKGTAEDPYEISTVEEFNAISTRLDAYYVQTANINFSDKQFYSIGDYSHPFKGHYDGKKFVLSGINAGYDEADYTGVFAFVYSGAVVENVRVEDSRFVGRQNVGAIAGLNAGKIDGAFVDAEIKVLANSGGGIAGANSGLISRCVNAGNIEVSDNYAGGITGVNSGIIKDSYNKGSINAGTYAGGIAGVNNGDSAVIERAFQVGEVNANASANITGDNMKGVVKQCRFVEGGNLKNICAFNGGSVYSSIARPQSEFKNGRAFNDWQNFKTNFMYVSSSNHPILTTEYIEVSQVEFKHGNSAQLKPGESISLEAHVLPSHASVQDVVLNIESGAEYCSLKDGVLSINEDAEAGEYIIIKGQAEGVASIFTISILPIRVEEVSLFSKDGKTTVAPGGVIEFDTAVSPVNASIKDVRYITSSPFADIDAYGRMKVALDTPIGLEITVTASSYDNIAIDDAIVVKVVEAQVKSVEISNTITQFKVTQNLVLSGVAITESLTTQNVEFEIIQENTTAVGARIINGTLYADMPGDICVVAKFAQVFSAPVLFVAQEEPVTSVAFRNGNTFAVDSALNLIVETMPENATYDDIIFTIVGANDIGARLSGNTLTATSAGIITVKAQAPSGVYATQTIYVRSVGDNSVKITDICLEKDSFVISRSLTLVPVIEPRNAHATVFFEIFSDGGTGVELVDGKLQNATKEGLIILRAYTSDYQTYVSVDALKVEVENVYFANANRFKVTKGLELAVATNPANPTYPQVEYEIVSSTAEDAQINGKLLTAKSIGQIVLRAWVDGVASKEFEIFVDKEPVTDVKFTSTKKSFKHTESLTLEAMAFPMQATFKDVEFVVDESLTDKQIGAKIEGDVLTAQSPGTVVVSMKCDGRVYPVVIAVEKEPVIEVSALNTNVLSANAGESIFRTSGVLELSALLYPDNATNQTLTISIAEKNATGAVLFKEFNGFDSTQELDSYYEITVVAGEKVYLTAANPGSIAVTVTPSDNENIATIFMIEVKEEPVTDIFFCLDSVAGSEAKDLMKEDVNILHDFGNGYYQYDQMFVKANQSGSRSSSLNFSVVTYAENQAVMPTFNGQFKLYYYTDYNQCLSRSNGQDITNILETKDLPNNNDFLVRTSPNFLSTGTRKKVIWVTVESVSGDDNLKVVSQPLKLTIFPTNISDIKTLKFDKNTGILSAGTSKIKDMSGYEVSLKFSTNEGEFGFTQYIPTEKTKLGLKLFRYGATPFDVSVKMIFDEGSEDRFEYQVPLGDFHGISGLVPKKQLQESFLDFECNYVVFYDLFKTSTQFDVSKVFYYNVKYMYLYGKSDVTHTNLDFSFYNSTEPIGITLHDINFIANDYQDAIEIHGTGALNLNVVGKQVTVKGGRGRDGERGNSGFPVFGDKAANGKNGANGDANWNPTGDIPHGQPGDKGTDGQNGYDGEDGQKGGTGLNGIKLAVDDNIKLKVSCSYFKIIGGQGGNGGNGGDGTDGQKGGDGGNGGNGSYKYIVVGWRAGHGGNGGDGGKGGNGGNAGNGGDRGDGGIAINANTNVQEIYKEDGKVGDKAGTAGKPGLGKAGGLGGSGGKGYSATTNRVDGTRGIDGRPGHDGATGKDGV